MEVLEKIKRDITERSKSKQISPLPNSGSCRIEYDYCYYKSSSEVFKDYYFVVSKFIDYRGNSIADFGKEVYIYDKNGNFVDSPELKSKCRGEFHKSLIDC
jgi:hypothetical protein